MNSNNKQQFSYWKQVWGQFKRHKLGVAALIIITLFCLIGIYAPFLASSKPFVVYFEGEWYFPLFRYLFYRGYYTKRLDLFYNLLIFTLPLFLLVWFSFKNHPFWRKNVLLFICFLQVILFLYFALRPQQDPAANLVKEEFKQKRIQESLIAQKQNPLLATTHSLTWDQEVGLMSPYEKLNLIFRYQIRKTQQEKLQIYQNDYAKAMEKKNASNLNIPTLWNMDEAQITNNINKEKETISKYKVSYPLANMVVGHIQQKCQFDSKSQYIPAWIVCDFLTVLSNKQKEDLIKAKSIVTTYEMAQARLKYIEDRQAWLKEKSAEMQDEVWPLVRRFHWEDDAGGNQDFNHFVSWWDLTRMNRKDMVASLIFGVRISLSVGILAVLIALTIGIPIGAIAGYYGGRVDIITYRLIEIWESMPTFFMLLMIVAFLESKSIFIVIAVIGFFGWTGFSRFVRGEFFKQKQLAYVEACHALGFNDLYIMFSHLLPNAIPPLLTLIPFAMMGAITSEAALSFLGLGEEGSGSWGVLMDEGRTAFPAESYLLWPPAILLTVFLVCIALVGDAFRDALDPKLHQKVK